MMLDEKPYTFDRVIRIAIAAALIWGVVWLLDYLSDVLVPFAVALLMAYLMNPLVEQVQKRVKNRVLAVGISLIGLSVAAVGVGWAVVPLIGQEVTQAGKLLSKLVTDKNLSMKGGELLPQPLWQAIKELIARPEVQEFFQSDSLLQMVESLARKLLPGIWGVITGTASFLLWLVGLTVIVLYLVFLLIDYQKVREGWRELLPKGMRGPVADFGHEFQLAMSRYFRGQALVAALVGVMAAVGFGLIGLPLGILLGLFLGLLNMVPYLQMVAFVPAFILSLIHSLETGTSLWVVFGLVILVFVVVQVAQDGFLVPKIMGKVTGLSPAMILLSLSIWGKLLGLLGLLIALPMTCLLLAYYRRYLATGSLALTARDGT